MKCSLIAILLIISNVLLIQGQKNGDKQITNAEVSKALTFKSILEDINSFYSQKDEQPSISLNPNVKAQLGTADAGDAGKANNAGNGDNAGDTGKAGNADNASDAGKAGNADNVGNAGNAGNADNTGKIDNAGNADDTAKTNNPFPQSNKDKDKKIGDAEDDEEPLKETGCGTDRSSLGMFAFHRPIKKSILVQNSNFTIMWYFANILPEYDYNYPTKDITFKLYREEDANPNSWGADSYKKPVFERTIPVSEVEVGPIIENKQTYQYNWYIDPSVDVKQTFQSNKKYRLRIYGDGKDVQSNSANFECYDDGDIQPATTREFYVVNNEPIDTKYYFPIKIEDEARMSTKISLIMTFMISMFVILYHNW